MLCSFSVQHPLVEMTSLGAAPLPVIELRMLHRRSVTSMCVCRSLAESKARMNFREFCIAARKKVPFALWESFHLQIFCRLLLRLIYVVYIFSANTVQHCCILLHTSHTHSHFHIVARSFSHVWKRITSIVAVLTLAMRYCATMWIELFQWVVYAWVVLMTKMCAYVFLWSAHNRSDSWHCTVKYYL